MNNDLVNLTDSLVFLKCDDGSIVCLKPCANPPKVKYENVEIGIFNNIPVVNQEMSHTDWVPEEVPHTCYVVTRDIFDAFPERFDLVVVGEGAKNSSGYMVYTNLIAHREEDCDALTDVY